MYKFEKGGTYVAVPAMADAPKRLVCVVGRAYDKRISFCDVRGVKLAHIDCIDGRETVRFPGDDGQDYFMSAVSKRDVAGAAETMAMMAN